MKVYNMLQAKSNLSRLVAQALAGEEVVLANRGEPVARIVPISPRGGGESQGQRLARFFELHSASRHGRSSDAVARQIKENREAWD
mgnify:CR=1 FL=1